MWIADMDFEVAPPITEAILRRAAHPLYGYEFRPDSYDQAIIDWVQRRGNWSIQREWLGFTPGVVAGYSFAVRAFAAAGEGIVIQPPVYPPFAHIIECNGRKVINNPLRDTGSRFEIDFEDLDRKLSEARAFLFCNPHNPTGRVFSRDELLRIGELCCRHDVTIISDEIHSDLVFKPSHHIHIASLSPEIAARTITFIAPSKTFNIAGLSTSVVITPNEHLRNRFLEEFDKVHCDQGNCFGRVALEVAYNRCEDWLDQVLDYIEGNMDYVRNFLEKNIPAIRTYRNEGTYLMWLDCRGLGLSHNELLRFFTQKAHLGLNDGATFGIGGEGHLRLNAATNRSTLERAMNQLLEACRQL